MSSELRARIKRFAKRLVGISVAAALGLTLIAYVVDSVVFRYRVGKNQALGQVTVTSYDAVAQKSGKTQFIFNDPTLQTCVHALFPHGGYEPCWYLQKHAEPRTDI